ncbi:MAG: hypothetical protein BHV67_06690 [Bacteroidales bacterium 43_36]|jgi:hypothetical protein|nr:hypothetical protein HMPREF0103_0058 [Bacteroides sp. 2_1_33B]OKY98211.1 MAG: hypothetical protein BHV67_06690 [Bacteroidales bacterium 43_36]UWG75657.1 MAG: protein of unknown function DUF4373 [Bacteriophage sp.]UWI27875.1 MAG: protein of unknown function DUF4373 [Bacteriophage sp.]
MARPNKEGLDYFPFDVDFFSDEKIGSISGEFGIKGEITAIKLLCAIYRNGYFILWNDALKMSLLRGLPGISLELLEQIVTRLVRWGFFEQTLFSTVSVLTSKGIQERYFKAIKRRKDSSNYPYLLVNVDNNKVNVSNNDINVNTNPIKERKGNKNRESLNTRETLFENFKNELLGDEEWRRYACQISGLSVAFNDLIPGELDNFLAWMVSTGEGDTLKTIDDVKRRFTYWWQGTGLRAYNQRHNGGTRKETFGGYTSHAGAYGKREAPAKTGVQPSEEARKDYTERF